MAPPSEVPVKFYKSQEESSLSLKKNSGLAIRSVCKDFQEAFFSFFNCSAFSMPKVTDPNSGRTVVNVRMWLTAAVKSGQRDSSFKH